MNCHDDHRVVLTLDAGGTNFAFAALRGGRPLGDAVTLPAEANDLDASLRNLAAGFDAVTPAGSEPAAISFAFPGPANYEQGVIENVGNLPAYSGQVPLGEILHRRFGVPVYINNDGDLFAYGEAVGGLLPEVNSRLTDAGSARRYRNLVGVTLGTGFGGGLVVDGRLLRGDNSAAGEVWLLPHGGGLDCCAEEGISIRGLVACYNETAGVEDPITPQQIALIARGQLAGDAAAAKAAFGRFGVVLGEALASLITVIDGLVVIGGGLTGAYDLFAPSMLDTLNGSYGRPDGKQPRLVQRVHNLENATDSEAFWAAGSGKHTGVGLSRLGANAAVALGAYTYAIARLDEHG